MSRNAADTQGQTIGRRLLPMLGHTSGKRSAVTCALKCDNACFHDVPNISENDYFLFTYENSFGMVRIVELSGPGQIQFVPPGGGVMTMVVESVVKRPQGIAYILRTSFERASNGYIEQQYITEEADYALTAEGLRVRIVRRPVSYFGDKGGSTGGARNVRVVEGVLKKR